jgi:hypothetical protein
MSSSGPRSAKPEWQKLYEAAVLELNQTALPSRVRAAKAAIHTKIVELRTAEPPEEDSRLDDALKMLERLAKIYD